MARFFLGQNTNGTSLYGESKFPYVDLRGKIPGNPQPSQGTVYKDAGTIVHWNGPKVFSSDIDQLYINARYHIQKDWGGGYYTNGIQYEWAVGHDGTKYRLRNPGSFLWHCGNPHYNQRAFAVTFIIGEGQRPTLAAKQSMAELCHELNRIQGLGKSATRGHQEVGASSCPGTGQTDFVVPFRGGATFVTNPVAPVKPTPVDKVRWVNYVYDEKDNWARKIATSMAEAGFEAGLRGGLTTKSAKAAGDARDQDGVYSFLVGEPAIESAKRDYGKYTKNNVDFNLKGKVRIVEAPYREKARWRIADFCEEMGVNKGKVLDAFSKNMGEATVTPPKRPAKGGKRHPGSGSYVQKHPTHFNWDNDVKRLVDRYEEEYYGKIYINTYKDHPPGHWWDSRSLDVWHSDGRGYALPKHLGDQVLERIFNDPDPPYIRYCIWQGYIWERGKGWIKYWDDNPSSDGGHYKHIHVTYDPVP